MTLLSALLITSLIALTVMIIAAVEGCVDEYFHDKKTIEHAFSFLYRCIAAAGGLYALNHYIHMPGYHFWFANSVLGIWTGLLYAVTLNLTFNWRSGDQWNYLSDRRWFDRQIKSAGYQTVFAIMGITCIMFYFELTKL